MKWLQQINNNIWVILLWTPGILQLSAHNKGGEEIIYRGLDKGKRGKEYPVNAYQTFWTRGLVWTTSKE